MYRKTTIGKRDYWVFDKEDLLEVSEGFAPFEELYEKDSLYVTAQGKFKDTRHYFLYCKCVDSFGEGFIKVASYNEFNMGRFRDQPSDEEIPWSYTMLRSSFDMDLEFVELLELSEGVTIKGLQRVAEVMLNDLERMAA